MTPVVVVIKDDGTTYVRIAPPDARISDELIGADFPAGAISVDGNLVTFCGDVTYQLTGWDATASAHIAERVPLDTPEETP